METRDFDLVDTLRSWHGYLYGKCARQLHYAFQNNKVSFTKQDKENMEWGKKNHRMIQDFLVREFPEYQFEIEKRFVRMLPIDGELGGITRIQATIDAYGIDMGDSEHQNFILEIKPMYSKKAYYQCMVQRIVLPNDPIVIFEYAGNFYKQLFKKKDGTLNIPKPQPRFVRIKADYEMSIIYVGRMITSLFVKPPRFPKASYSHATCKGCMYREQCYRHEETETWESFRKSTEPFILRLRQNLSKSKLTIEPWNAKRRSE